MKQYAVPAVCALALPAVVSFGLSKGAVPLHFSSVLHALFHYSGNTSDLIVIWMRLPRVVLGILVGAALGVAGAVLQGISRNPLADPAILGINGGAALALLCWLTLRPASAAWTQSIASLVGASAAVLIITAVIRVLDRGDAAATMVVAGAAVNGALASFTVALVLLTGETLERLQFWLVGSLAARDWPTVSACLPFLVLGIMAALPMGRMLNALGLGEQVSHSLGFHPARVRLWGVCAALLLCAGSVAAAGPIGFIGLLVPHALRPLIGHDYRRLLPASAIAGSVILPLCDLIARSALVPFYGELPVGLVTALVGAPVLVLVLQKQAARA